MKTFERKASILLKQHTCTYDQRIHIFCEVTQRRWVRCVRQPWKLAKRSSSWTAWPWRQKHLEQSKRRIQRTRRRNVTLQKTSILNHKAVITSNNAKITYLLTYSMEQSTSWEANRFAASEEIPRILWNTKTHCRIHKCRHLSLSWARSIQSILRHPTA
jgi:hypothetical protein